MGLERPIGHIALSFGNAFAFSVHGGPTGPAAARNGLAEHVSARLDPDTVELAQLLLSELASNCVQHGAAHGRDVSIRVTASLFPSMLRVEVCDGGMTFRHTPHLPSHENEAGCGLWLVDELSKSWGISEGDPARVWFELARSA